MHFVDTNELAGVHKFATFSVHKSEFKLKNKQCKVTLEFLGSKLGYHHNP